MTKAVVTLVIYAYSSFTASHGAGPEIIKKFESQCQCKVELVNAGDGGSMLSKVKLEGEKTKADLLVGVDAAFLYRIKKDLGWEVKPVKFDYSPLAFVYKQSRVQNPPSSLDDLLEPQWKGQIVIEDPRLSTTGLNFLLWVIAEKGEEEGFKYLKNLKPQIKLITPSWELAYGLFKKDQVKLVLSYWTSPAYHIQEEKTEDYKAASFKSGLYRQDEFAVVNPRSGNKKLAEGFLEFLVKPEAQEILPAKNFMYPVNAKAELPAAFKKLGKAPILTKSLNQSEIESKLEGWLQKWRNLY